MPTRLRLSPWQEKLHEIIFEADTPAGKLFDVGLIITILLSVVIVLLDSVKDLRDILWVELYIAEWVFTLIFTAEYILRLACVGRPMRYALSFFGIVDLMAILPTFLSVLFPGTQYLLVIRLLRILRIFRVLKLARFLNEANELILALRASVRKIMVFLFAVLTLVVIFGSLMYLVEGEENGFTSIPRSIYWAVVTLTTVGYGDISPKTGLGQFLASIIMILGYGIIAVPTGMVTAELTKRETEETVNTRCCLQCGGEGHDPDALHCKHCGALL